MPSVHALPSQNPAGEIPPLAPPLPEMAPSYWEQHSLWPVVVSSAVTGLVLALLFRWLRPRKPAGLVPPANQARATLAALQARPEDGATLSQISQTLRRYLIAALALPAEEQTTAEFCGRLSHCPALDPELAAAVGVFLRQCDERKFSPTPPAAPLNAAQRALELVEQSEARRAMNSSGPVAAPR